MYHPFASIAACTLAWQVFKHRLRQLLPYFGQNFGETSPYRIWFPGCPPLLHSSLSVVVSINRRGRASHHGSWSKTWMLRGSRAIRRLFYRQYILPSVIPLLLELHYYIFNLDCVAVVVVDFWISRGSGEFLVVRVGLRWGARSSITKTFVYNCI